MYKYVFFLLILIFLYGCSKANRSYASVSAEQLRAVIRDNPNAVLIDVRTSGEYNGPLYHIDKSVSIPLSDLSESIKNLDKDNRSYYMICKSGARSKMATKIMNENGFNAFNVTGGMMDWVKLNK